MAFVFVMNRIVGLTGAKSALEVKDKMTFLDLTIRQIEHLNATHATNVPLLLMTSFNTHHDTLRIIENHAKQNVHVTVFNQSRYPRITEETLLPCPTCAAVDSDKKAWYPPGHGDLYNALTKSGILASLLKQGKEYLFVSNSDNLGAVLVHRYSVVCNLKLMIRRRLAWTKRSSSTSLNRKSIF
jgi:UTP--glucose-1-phosphate uridylyltransferase